jgi:dolichol-phosphate mannosyltransferase
VISIVIPVFNEEDCIELLYLQLVSVLSEIEMDYEIIFVDDGSTDDSVNLIKALNQSNHNVKLVQFSRNFGHQIALTAGLDYARGQVVVVMDADLQHPPEFIPEMLKKWREGFDIVYTVRQDTEDASLLKRVTANCFYILFNKLAHINMPSNSADFRLMDRKVVNSFKQIRERTRFMRGLTSWIGFNTTGIEYIAKPRAAGETKYSIKKMIKFAIEGITSFSTVPLYFSIYLGFLFSGLGFFYSLYVIYIRIFSNIAIPGWSSTIMLTTIIGGIQLITLGMIGVYIGKIFDEVKQRPLYLVQTLLGFGNGEENKCDSGY